jgi:hypothetical protein
MSKSSNGINKVRHPAVRNSCGIGYVILSRELKTVEYLTNSFRNSTATIITESNEIIKNVYIDRSSWQEIEFPDDVNKRGSCVVWLNLNAQNKPVIIAVLNKKDQINAIQTRNSFKFSKNSASSGASIEGIGDGGVLNMIVNGVTKEESQVNIRILNDSGEGLLDLLVQGDIVIDGERNATIKLKNALYLNFIDESENSKQANISYEMGVGLIIKDEFGNTWKSNEDGVSVEVKDGGQITTKDVNKDVEPALLGDKTESLLNEIFDTLKSISSTLARSAAAGATGPTAAMAAAMSTGNNSTVKNLSSIDGKIKMIKSSTVKIS